MDLYVEWIRASGNPNLKNALQLKSYDNVRFCERHFLPNDILNRRLRDGVIPTLNLPDPLSVEVGIDMSEEAGGSKINITPPIVDVVPPSYLEAALLRQNKSSPRKRIADPLTPAGYNILQEASGSQTDVTLHVAHSTSSHVKMSLSQQTSEVQLHMEGDAKLEEFDDVQSVHIIKSLKDSDNENTIVYPAPQHSQERKIIKKKYCLSMIGKNKLRELTPSETILHKELLRLSRKCSILEKKKINFKSKLAAVKQIVHNTRISDLYSRLTPFQMRFFECQIRNAYRKKAGRKYTFEEKADAIALWKTSPHMYRLLSHLFTLPSPSTLRLLLSKIILKPGISTPIFSLLKKNFGNKTARDRICILMFDEMVLQPHLEYIEHEDVVCGFEDTGYSRGQEVANHVIVFMLRGLYRNWKQPVAYAFCKATMSSANIVRYYKGIIRQAKDAGLIVIASVCDQGATNVRAIQMLREDTKRVTSSQSINLEEGIVLVDDVEVIPIFDPPHLLKSVRNNLLTKNLFFSKEDKQYTAKWEHILSAYNIDKSFNIGLLKKLTDFHVLPDKIKKMKVSVCAQVFSETVAAGLKAYALFHAHSADSNAFVTKEALDTVELILFLDKLFDSVNGTTGSTTAGKYFKRPASSTSRHAQFWRSAIQLFVSMKFLCTKPEHRPKPPVLNGWITTLRGFLLIQRKLLSLGFTRFSPRFCNQDPIENFFGQIRQYGYRNTNPTCAAFGPYFKSLLIKNFTSLHAKGSNCEDDEGTIAVSISTLMAMHREEVVPERWQPSPITPRSASNIETMAVAYVAGYLSKNKINTIKDCDICRLNIVHSGEPHAIYHRYVQLKERFTDLPRLQYINTNIIENLINIYNLLENIVPSALNTNCLLARIVSYINCKVSLNLIPCSHTNDIQNLFIKNFIKLYLYAYIKTLNNIVEGKHIISQPNAIEAKMVKLSKFYKKINF